MFKFLLGILISLSLFGQDSTSKDSSKASELYLSVRRTTVDSATAKNALSTTNSLFLNRLAQGSRIYSIPLTNEFSGTLITWGWSKEHSPFYKGIFEMEGGVLKAGEQKVLTSVIGTSFFLGASLYNDVQRLEILNKSQLSTGRIGYTGILHFLHKQPNPYLQKLGLIIGGEIYGNQAINSGDIALQSGYLTIASVSGTSSSSTTYNQTGVSILQQELKHTEGFLNLVLGLNYSLEFLKQHKLNFSYKIYESLAELEGGFSGKFTTYLSLTNLIFPSTVETKGNQRTKMQGNSIHLSYRYSVTESFGIRLGFSEYDATHKVEESKVKEPVSAFTLFMRAMTGGDVLTPYLAGSLPAFGPYPSAKDKRTQIQIEFIYMF